jgi:hypothetical protein
VSKFYETDSEARWWAGIYGRIIIAALLISALSLGGYLISVAFSGKKGQLDQKRQRNSNTNRTFQQQHFEDLYADYQASVQKVPIYAAQAKTGDPTSQTNLIGLQSHCLDVANQYNQDSAKVLAGNFKTADLPVTLDATTCQGK